MAPTKALRALRVRGGTFGAREPLLQSAGRLSASRSGPDFYDMFRLTCGRFLAATRATKKADVSDLGTKMHSATKRVFLGSVLFTYKDGHV